MAGVPEDTGGEVQREPRKKFEKEQSQGWANCNGWILATNGTKVVNNVHAEENE